MNFPSNFDAVEADRNWSKYLWTTEIAEKKAAGLGIGVIFHAQRFAPSAQIKT
jgi:hypothetical protein